jgi:hypothetical protein
MISPKLTTLLATTTPYAKTHLDLTTRSICNTSSEVSLDQHLDDHLDLNWEPQEKTAGPNG